MIRIFNYSLLPVLILVIISTQFFSCAYFNTFYNAETSYNKALKIIEESPILEEDKFPEQAKKLLRDAIDNSKMVIQKFPDSKYVDDAIFIIAKSSFLRDEVAIAESYFIQLIREYPESKFYNLSEIWLAYTHLRMDMVNIARDEINVINHRQSHNEEELYLIYNILAEIAVIDENLNDILFNYEKAAENASSKSKQVSMYSKLVLIADKNFNKVKASTYLLELASIAPDKIRIDARMKWIEYQRELENYDGVISEIQRMLGLAEFSSEHMRLELELGKAYKERGEMDLSKEIFNMMIEKYLNSKKDEIAEVYYQLGIMALMNDFNLDLSREYFESSKSTKLSSFYGRASKDFINKISHYETLLDLYEESLNMDKTDTIENDDANIYINNKDKKDNVSEEDIDITKNEKNIDPRSRKMDFESQKLNQASNTSPGQPDSLLFIMGEMLLYDFNHLELSLENLQLLIKKYPESKFAPQSLYVLSYYKPDEDWNNLLITNYPKASLLFQSDSIKLDSSINFNMEKKRDYAWSLADNSYQEAHDEFNYLYNTFNDTLSAYIRGYISDYYLNDMAKAVRHYQTFVDSFPGHSYFAKVEDRLKIIETDLAIQKSISQQALDYKYAVDYLNKAKDYDSTKILLDKITKEGKSQYKEAAKQLKTVIVEYQNISNEIYRILSPAKEDSSLVNNIPSQVDLNIHIDSLIYDLAKIFHYELEFRDSAIHYYEKIIFSYKNSKYRPYALMTLSDLNISDKWIDLLISEYPDTTFEKDTTNYHSTYNREVLLENFVVDQDKMINSIDKYLDYFSPSIDSIEIIEDSTVTGNNSTTQLEMLNDSTSMILDTNITDSDSVMILVDIFSDKDSLMKSVADTTLEFQDVDSMETKAIDLLIDSTSFILVSSNNLQNNLNQDELIDSLWIEHIVRKGETLYTISNNILGSAKNWSMIYNWNKEIIEDGSYRIMPYQVLKIQPLSTQINDQGKENSIYTIQVGETLWDIAAKIYNDPFAWQLLVYDNLKTLTHPDSISVNQELIIRSELHFIEE